jgi:hypothetical protein
MFAAGKLLLLMLGLALTGCIHTQELPLAPNMVRLDTQASGLLFAGQATNQTMRRAAELTLQNGFTHFRFEQASLQQGSQMADVLFIRKRDSLWHYEHDDVRKHGLCDHEHHGQRIVLLDPNL